MEYYDDYDDYAPTRRTSSAVVRYVPKTPKSKPALDRSQPVTRAVPARSHRRATEDRLPALVRSRAIQRLTEEATPAVRRAPRYHWLVWAGGVLAAMLLGNIVLTPVWAWWAGVQDDQRYGRPRTYQVDMRVGHDDDVLPSHFVAQNLHGHFTVTEYPPADPSKTQIYVVGPMLSGNGADLVPITLEFKDVNGDKRLDMVVHVRDTIYAYLNDQKDGHGTFRVPKPEEKIDA
jgi:hypothetical protein